MEIPNETSHDTGMDYVALKPSLILSYLEDVSRDDLPRAKQFLCELNSVYKDAIKQLDHRIELFTTILHPTRSDLIMMEIGAFRWELTKIADVFHLAQHISCDEKSESVECSFETRNVKCSFTESYLEDVSLKQLHRTVTFVSDLASVYGQATRDFHVRIKRMEKLLRPNGEGRTEAYLWMHCYGLSRKVERITSFDGLHDVIMDDRTRTMERERDRSRRSREGERNVGEAEEGSEHEDKGSTECK